MFGGVADAENEPVLVAVPCFVVTVIFPEVASAGTPAVIVVVLGCEKGASTPLNRTEVVELNPLPEMVTVVATGPDVGVKEEICGDGAAAPAADRPSNDRESTPVSAIPTRRLKLAEDRTATDLLEGLQGVRALVDPEVHRYALEVCEGMRVDHRLHGARRAG